MKERIGQMNEIRELVLELMEGDENDTDIWIMMPNAMMFGDTPFEVCMRGDGHHIIAWLKERLK